MLVNSIDVPMERPVKFRTRYNPVVSSPAPNVMLCGPPAGNVPPDVVHTMLSTTDVIVQLDKDAVPECATSTPTGAVFWVK